MPLLHHIQQLLSQPGYLRLLGCYLARATLNEFASSSRSSAAGLTWEYHLTAKQDFERDHLKTILIAVVQTLQPLAAAGGQQLQAALPALEACLAVAEMVLQWQFSLRGAHRLLGSFEAEPIALFKPPESWEDTLTPDLVSLFAQMYGRLRTFEPVCNRVTACLVQLAAVSQSNFSSPVTLQPYLAHYVSVLPQLHDHLVSLCASGATVFGTEVLALGTAFSRLSSNFSMKAFDMLGAQALALLLQGATSLTNLCAARLAEEDETDGDTFFAEAFDALVEGWVFFALAEPGEINRSQYLSCIGSVYEGFVAARLKKARLDALSGADDEESDLVLYASQLKTTACLSRVVPDLALAHLGRELVLRQQQWRECMSGAAVSSEVLAVLYEELHWLLIFSGHLLTDSGEGETSCVPESIMEFSRQSHSSLLALVNTVIELSVYESSCITANLSDRLSPQVAATISWFLKRWADTYLMMREEDYDIVSESLLSNWGAGSQSAMQIM
jgi:hypothetical protein